MGYNAIGYLAVFLPAVILIYSLVPQKKRWIVVLAANYLFFYLLSGFLLLYNVAATLFTYYMGKLLGAKKPEGVDKKAFKKKKNKILLTAILVNFGVLIVLKYTNFFGSSIAGIINHFGGDVRYRAIRFLVPIGISYYTMQAVSYLIDVNRGTLKVENNLAQLALYLSYFPTIMEGSITRYKDVAEDIYAGHPVTYENLTAGYQRIVWGLFKKVIIADILVKPVIKIFEGFQYDGAVCLYGAAICTLQLYMDFAGTIDIVIGTGKIFNVTIAENFRQPFFAKNASEFWRRWHITLGTWFKDYIFYPISVAKPIRNLTKKAQKRFGKGFAKFVTPSIALLGVWMANGFWHGPRWTYIFYGVYYYVMILLELLLERPLEIVSEKLHFSIDGIPFRIFRFVKLFFIVIIGEMLFTADTLTEGFRMLHSIFTNFSLRSLWANKSFFGMSGYEYIVVFFAVLVVLIYNTMREFRIPFEEKFAKLPEAVRWCGWLLLLFAVIMFGAYGPGYDAVAMIYAGF